MELYLREFQNFGTLKTDVFGGPSNRRTSRELKKIHGYRNDNGKINKFRLAKQYFNLHVHHAFWTLLDDGVKLPFTFILLGGGGGEVGSRTQFSFFFSNLEKALQIPFLKNRHYLEREELLKATLLPPGRRGYQTNVYAGRLRPEVQPLPFYIEYFHSRGQHLCKFIATKESVCIRKKFNPPRIGIGQQHGRHFIVLETNMAAVMSRKNTLQ